MSAHRILPQKRFIHVAALVAVMIVVVTAMLAISLSMPKPAMAQTPTPTPFNRMGQPEYISDPFGDGAQMAYDDRNHLTSVTDARGSVTWYEYQGNLLSQYEYESDGVGNRVAVTETVLTPGSGEQGSQAGLLPPAADGAPASARPVDVSVASSRSGGTTSAGSQPVLLDPVSLLLAPLAVLGMGRRKSKKFKKNVPWWSWTAAGLLVIVTLMGTGAMFTEGFRLPTAMAAPMVAPAASVPQALTQPAVGIALAPKVPGDLPPLANSSLPADTAPGTLTNTVAPTNTDWLNVVQDAIRQSEYHVTWQEQTALPDLPQAYQAPNRASNLRTYFTPSGIRVIPRTAAPAAGRAGGWEWGLRLIGHGYTGAIQAAAPITWTALSVVNNRIEYPRGALTEWYVNDERGLKQGFTLNAAPRPAGNSRSGIVLELALSGNLIPNVSEDGAAIEFVTAGGVRVLRYSDLRAYDAVQEDLPAQMTLATTGSQRTIRITVDDSAAVYPITIDPLATSPTWSAESNQANAQFGSSVGTAGDVNGDGYDDVIIGAPYYDDGQTDEGRVWVYYGSTTGVTTTVSWTAEGDQDGARFGASVGTAGDVNGDGYDDVIIGAPYYDDGQTDEGRVYVYHGSASGLAASANWTAESDQADARFGFSVGTAGSVNGDSYADVIVGAPLYDNGQTDEGRAFVYHGSSSGLAASANWTAESNQASAQFGYSVGTAGDVNDDGYADVIAGAPLYDNGQTDEGRAFVYHGSSSGLAATANWTAESNQASAQFGYSVGTAGDVGGGGYADVIVGAPYYDHYETDEGRASVYFGSSSGLDTSTYWTMNGGQASAQFGCSVGAAGDVSGDGYSDVIVGACLYDNGQTDEGRAYVYYGAAYRLNLRPAWTVEGDQSGANLGSAVGTAGDVNGDGYADVIVGASLYDNGQTDEGRASVYLGSARNTTADWTADGDQVSAQVGYSVGAAGDVNGDGYDDVIVGAPYYDDGQTDEGRAWVYYGSTTGVTTTASWTAEGEQAGARFGWVVRTAGDVNGDGYGDVVVGAPYYDNGQTDEGRVLVYHGSASGLVITPTWTMESNQASAYLGRSLGTAGDVNGDGYDDVIISAPYYDNGQTNEGKAWVYHGSASGLETAATWTAEGDQANAYFGYSVGAAGDVNGDGYSDVVVGASHYDNGQTDEGRAYVYHGSASGLSTTANWTIESDQADARLGRSVGTAGDVNGDGYADVIIGMVGYDTGETDAGRAQVHYGSASGLSASPNWKVEGDQGWAYLSYPVSAAGDVNGDGYADILVGAYNADNGQVDEGRVFVYYGSASGPATSANWTAEGDQAGAWFGYAAGAAGDVNGDGYGDVIIGAPLYDNGQTDEGRVLVYHGSASGLVGAADWRGVGNQDWAQYGFSVGTAGDVNGDGYDDVIVGAPSYDNDQTSEGRVFVYYGSTAGVTTTASWTAEGNQASAYFGYSVGTAGDVNGDGYDDVIIGAVCYSNGETQEGRALVYHGSASGLAITATWTAESDQGWAYLGLSVGTAGDVNGDGYDDVIVGAPNYNNGEMDEGRALVYYGSPSGLSATANWTAESDQADALFGTSVGAAGDVNGDGYDDVIVGAYLYDDDQTDEGRAFVYYGSVSGLSTPADWTAEGDQDNAHFGYSASGAGDVNGDGYSDVIVGAYLYDNEQTDEGRAFVYYGSSSGLSTSADWTAESDQAGAQLGFSVGGAGDVNGDRYGDVIVGANLYDNGQAEEGCALVYHGSASGLSTSADWTAESNQDLAYLSYSAGAAGDVNGDGYDDVILGAPYYDDGQFDEGAAFVYYGAGTATEVQTIGPEGGVLTFDNAQLQVEFPQDAVTQTTRVEYSLAMTQPITSGGMGVALAFELNAWPVGGSQPITQFVTPLTLTMNVTGLMDFPAMPVTDTDTVTPTVRPYLAYQGPTGQWIEMPFRVDYDMGAMVAQVDHLTEFEMGLKMNQWLLKYEPPHAALFSGAATYRIAFQATPGRNGLQPELALSYSSRQMDGQYGRFVEDEGPVPQGWSLDAMDIVRTKFRWCTWGNGKDKEDGVCTPDVFSLAMNGTSYELYGEPGQQYGRYYAKDAPELYIERINDCSYGCSYGASGAPNHTGEYWIVRMPDGTQARFGYDLDAEQCTAVCRLGESGCQSPREGYRGRDPAMTARRWRVDQVTDVYGNKMTFHYEEYKDGDWFNGHSTLRHIYYNFTNEDSYLSEVGLPGAGGPHPTIDTIVMTNTNNSGYKVPVRRYVLGRTTEAKGGSKGGCDGETDNGQVKLSVLSSLQEFSGDGSIPFPAQKFSYTWLATANDFNCYPLPRLGAVENGYGARTGITYQEDGGPGGSGYLGLEYKGYRVQGIGTSGGVEASPAMSSTYTYGEPCFDRYINDGGHFVPGPCTSRVTAMSGPDTKGPLVGHKVVTETQRGAGGQVLAQSIHRFNIGQPDLIGREWQTQQVNPSSGAVLQQQDTWWVTTTFGANTTFAYTKAVTTTQDGKRSRVDYEYNPAQQSAAQYGNVTAEYYYGDLDATGDERTIRRLYHPLTTTGWIVNKLARETVYSGVHYADDGQGIASRTCSWYDNRNWDQPPLKGAATQAGRWKGQPASSECEPADGFITSRTGYDQWGNPTVVTDTLGRTMRRQYDDQYHLYPAATTDALSYTARYGFDRALGVPLVVTDTNGAAIRYAYDASGRLTKVIKPYDGEADPTQSYAYADDLVPWKITTRQLGGDGDTLDSVQFYDGLGRPLQTRTAAEDGQRAVTNVLYDALGRKQTEYVAKFSSSWWDYEPNIWQTQPRTTMQYDALGRTVVITAPDDTTTRTSYQGWTTTVVDANGHQKSSTADAFGKLVTVQEYTGTAGVDLSLYATTRYAYDTLGNLTRVTDTLSHTTVITYDALGRKTAMNDPDMGAWTYEYDAAGNLITQTDALGRQITFAYDALNRVTSKRSVESGGWRELARYGYDQGANGIGRRTAMTDVTGVTTWAYDARGRVLTETRAITGGLGTYTTSFTYDSADRVVKMTYPDGEVVNNQYKNFGALRRLDSLQGGAYVQSATYDALGQMTEMLLGNDLFTTYGYDPQMHRLTTIQTGPQGQTDALQNLTYTYDAVGNVRAITDTTSLGALQVQTFGYDPLDRLTRGYTSGGQGGYDESYAYDEIGNMTRKGPTGTPATLGYTDTAHVHAVTGLSGGPGGGSHFEYDANGNMTLRVEVSGTQVTTYYQQFDVENRLVVVTATNGITQSVTRLAYDGDGARVLQIAEAGTTVYIGDHYEEFLPGVQISNLQSCSNVSGVASHLTGGKTPGLASLKRVAPPPGRGVEASRVMGGRSLEMSPAAPVFAPSAMVYPTVHDDGAIPPWSYSGSWSVITDATAYGGAYHKSEPQNGRYPATLQVPAGVTAVSIRFGPDPGKWRCVDPNGSYPYEIQVDGVRVWSSDWNYPAWQEITFSVGDNGHTVQVLPYWEDCNKGSSLTIDAGSFRYGLPGAGRDDNHASWSYSNAPESTWTLTNSLQAIGDYYRHIGRTRKDATIPNPDTYAQLSLPPATTSVLVRFGPAVSWSPCAGSGSWNNVQPFKILLDGALRWSSDSYYNWQEVQISVSNDGNWHTLKVVPRSFQCNNPSITFFNTINVDAAAILSADTTPPTLPTITAPQYFSASLTITWTTAADIGGSGVASCTVEYQVEGKGWNPPLSCMSPDSMTLNPGENVYIRATAKDNADNWSTSNPTRTVIYDGQGPTGSVTITGVAGWTSTPTVTLGLSASDAASGVSQMVVLNSCGGQTAWEDYATSRSWVLCNGVDGLRTVKARYRDAVGNESADSQASINLDQTAPGGSITAVNGIAGLTWTNNPNITLTLGASDSGSGGVQMRFRDIGSWSGWETFSTSKVWTLSGEDGLCTVCAQFRDAVGNTTGDTAITKTVWLDRAAPAVTVTKPAEGIVWGQRTYDVQGSTETTATLESLCIQSYPLTSTCETLLPVGTGFAQSVDLAEGANTIIITATDKAHNRTVVSRTLTYDASGPIKVTDLQPRNDTRQVRPVISARFSVTGTATVATSTVQVKVKDSDVTTSTTITSEGFTYTPASALEDGNVPVSVALSDTVGNSAEAMWSFTVDTFTSLTDLEPASGSAVNTATTKVEGTAEMGATVVLTVNSSTRYTNPDWTGARFTFSSVGLQTGNNVLELTSTDAAGNQAQATLTVTLDTVSPVVSVSTQRPIHSSVVTATWVVTETGSGIASYTVDVVRVGDNVTMTRQVGLQETQYVYQGNRGESYRVRVTAIDRAGNAGYGEALAQAETVRKYYSAAGRRVAMRVDGVVYFLHTDHLGSTSLVTCGSSECEGTPYQGVVARQLYLPYGAPRWSSGTLPTDFTYTGQRSDATGLMYYRARYYSSIMQYVSADSIVPGTANGAGSGAATIGYDPKTRLTPLTVNLGEFATKIGEENREIAQYGWFFKWDENVREKHNVPMGLVNPQSLNRYSYCLNNPLRYADPTGHSGIGNALSYLATALDITATGLSFSGVLIEGVATAAGTTIPIPGGGTAVGLGAGIVQYQWLNAAENVIGMASFVATGFADVFNGETYPQTVQLPTMQRATELVIGQDTLVSLIGMGTGLWSPEAIVDTGINGLQVRYDMGRLSGEIPSRLTLRVGVTDHGLFYSRIMPKGVN